ncbi:ferredoxin [Sulfuriflexus sp.]|uniref:ferredoxin n=1 Tax=Sulfuriflexus sp. TaxID=2015443 RepID=UPI0028CD12E1|nr:ferredoxin [Sulfuriflexus sp.]MDT8405249.1 ferredoxin [Sulfuriflexus sp.]
MVLRRKQEMGAGGSCICPKCDTRIAHQNGVPCQEERCPDCGAKMLREGSYHHQLFQEKQARKQQSDPDTSEK